MPTEQIEVTAKNFSFPFHCWFKSRILLNDHFHSNLNKSLSVSSLQASITWKPIAIGSHTQKRKRLTNVPCDNAGRRTEVGMVKGWQTEAVTRHFVKRKKERQKEEMTHKISAINLQLWCRPCVHLVDIRADRKQNAGGDTLEKKLPEEWTCQLMCCCLMRCCFFFFSSMTHRLSSAVSSHDIKQNG